MREEWLENIRMSYNEQHAEATRKSQKTPLDECLWLEIEGLNAFQCPRVTFGCLFHFKVHTCTAKVALAIGMRLILNNVCVMKNE